MKTRILVTAVGGTLAPLNIRLLKRSRCSDVWVLGVDSRADAAGRYFADAFARVPPGDDPAYSEAILSLVRQHGIDLILPWSDEEALALAAQREALAAAGGILACAPLSTLQIMTDKAASYRLLSSAGVRMPAWQQVGDHSALADVVEQYRRDHGEFAVKPVTARGNRGTVVVRKDVDGVENYMGSRELHMDFDTFRRAHLEQFPLPAIVMERLFPPAYDIDVLAKDGIVLRAMPRRRLNPAGVPFMGGVLTPTRELFDLASLITKAMNLSWLYDYDLMTNARGEAVPIEINPRPSGSIAAAIVAGVPFYDDLIALKNGLEPAKIVMPRETTIIPFLDCHVVSPGQTS